jgi:cytochrome c oxidase cbb3-type subunit 3
MEMAVPKKEVGIETPLVNIKKINSILTDAVAIEEEHTILMQHEYDGIRELDNNLPPWWVWGFIATIIFAVVYLINYHVLGTSDLQIQAYNKEKAQAKIEVDAYLKKMALNVDETNVTILSGADALGAGKSIFKENCVSCHLDKGEGQTGPNLTDKQWIYGFDIKEVFKSIKAGRPNGMPEHTSKLNPVQIQQVASYVLSLPEVKGKEAQGTFIEK